MSFRVETKGIKDFQRVMRKMPRMMTTAVGFTLNDMAFGARSEMLKYISQTMTVRNQGFIKRQMWAQRAKFSEGINRMQSVAGSVRKDRFTGWKEQVQGADMQRDRAITTDARSGSKSRQVRKGARLRPGTKWDEPRMYKGNSSRNRANTMLQTIGRTRSRKPFIIYGHRTLTSGLWMFSGGPKDKRRLVVLQLFNRSTKVRRDPWHIKATKRYLAANPPGRTFAKNATKAVKKKLKMK